MRVRGCGTEDIMLFARLSLPAAHLLPAPTLPADYEKPPNMRTSTSTNIPDHPWAEKSALGRLGPQDVADVTRQEVPAYQRAGKPDPYMQDISNKLDKLQAQQGKPKVDIKDVQAQAQSRRELQKQISGDPRPAVWKDPKNPDLPASKSPPPANVELPKDSLGKVSAGEPTLSNKPLSGASSVERAATTGAEAGAEAGLKAGSKSLGSKLLGKAIPGVGVALDAEEAYRRYQNGDRTGAVISALGAAGGLLPGVGPAISYGATGVNLARDAYNSASGSNAKSLNPVTTAANQRAQEKGMTGRGSQSKVPPVAAPVKPSATSPTQTNTIPKVSGDSNTNPNALDDKETIVNPQTPPESVPKAAAVKPPASTGTSAPATPISNTSGYKGTAGAQSIQQANPNKISNVNYIRAGDTIKVGDKDYTIKPGDTLDKIASRELNSPSSVLSAPQTQQSALDKEPTQNNSYSSTQADESATLNRMKSLAGIK